MSWRPTVLSTALLLACVAAPAGAAEAGQFVGKWHWNKTASSVDPNEPAPKDIVLEIRSADPAHVQWTVTAIDTDGKAHVTSFDGPADNTPRPLQGSAPGETAAFSVDSQTLKAIYRDPSGATDTQSCSLSADGRKMTCAGTEADGKGKSDTYTDAYDRL